MKPDKAIKELQERIDIAKKHYAEEVPEYIEVLEYAVRLIRKQKPMLPRPDDNGSAEYYESWVECPVCSEAIPEYTEEHETECYCLYCGQKLNWG